MGRHYNFATVYLKERSLSPQENTGRPELEGLRVMIRDAVDLQEKQFHPEKQTSRAPFWVADISREAEANLALDSKGRLQRDCGREAAG